MNSLEIKTYPDPCLRIKTKPVDQFNNDLKSILQSMSNIMYINQGIGLAATQVGLGLSILVVDVGDGLMNFVNPEVVEKSKKKGKLSEGCLSLPGINVVVARPETIKLRAQNENGEFFIKKFDGLLATALQHEMDHLNGRLIIDYLDPVRAFLSKRKLKKTKDSIKEKTCEVVCNVGRKDK